MHQSVLDFTSRAVTPKMVKGKTVLEVGSLYVNGSVRSHIESLKPATYVGVDLREGPGVDQVADCEHLTQLMGAGCWDLILSTETLEHVNDWRACMLELAAALAPAGVLLITARSPGFGYHEYPIDKWRYRQPVMRTIIETLNLQVSLLEDDPEAPGVFLLATKPSDWKTPDPAILAGIDIDVISNPNGDA